MSNATRIEVGQCDLGYVFIFRVTSADGERWRVHAGSHAIGTYADEAQANAVARTLCGEQQLTNEYAAEAPMTEPMAAYVKETREKVGKK